MAQLSTQLVSMCPSLIVYAKPSGVTLVRGQARATAMREARRLRSEQCPTGVPGLVHDKPRQRTSKLQPHAKFCLTCSVMEVSGSWKLPHPVGSGTCHPHAHLLETGRSLRRWPCVSSEGRATVGLHLQRLLRNFFVMWMVCVTATTNIRDGTRRIVNKSAKMRWSCRLPCTQPSQKTSLLSWTLFLRRQVMLTAHHNSRRRGPPLQLNHEDKVVWPYFLSTLLSSQVLCLTACLPGLLAPLPARSKTDFTWATSAFHLVVVFSQSQFHLGKRDSKTTVQSQSGHK